MSAFNLLCDALLWSRGDARQIWSDVAAQDIDAQRGERSEMDEVLGLAEVLMFVPDVQAAKPWYAGLLGSAPIFDAEGYCAFRLAGSVLGLHPSDEKNTPGTGQVTYWRVADIQRMIAHFEAHGCHKYRGPILGVDQVWVCQMQDPFGNLWGLVEHPVTI